jgi:nicotinic acid phosphoribosyltransferase
MSKKYTLPNAAALDAGSNAYWAGMAEMKRTQMWREYLSKWFLLGGLPTATDTYKRTMWAAAPDIATADGAYHLTMRKGLPEEGADNQLIMAGHEVMLAQWFHRPLKRSDIELAAWFSSQNSAVKAFPHAMWEQVIRDQKAADKIYLPVDIWGFPGGQTFVPGVPCLSFEGMGGVISYLEPAMCRYFMPIIHATKARIFKGVTPRDAEFGLRAAFDELVHIALLLARYVGGRNGLTSNDSAEFLLPALMRVIGTVGHEFMCAAQSFDKSLADAEYEMMERAATGMVGAKLLPDLVDAESVGLENALRVMLNHPEREDIGVRVDSGDIAGQCVAYFRRMRERGIKPRIIVFEDEVSPTKVFEVCDHFRRETGEEPTLLFPGAGGYWWRLVHRDTVSAAFKRSATQGHPNVKFSNSPGKGSLGGYLRVYGRGDTMIVADRSEQIDGEPLFVKLVSNGRIVYRESFERQADRADATWGRYKRFELSALVAQYKERFDAMRAAAVAEARRHLAA